MSGQSASTKQSTPWTGTGRECVRGHGGLLEDAVDESGAIAGSDEELFDSRS